MTTAPALPFPELRAVFGADDAATIETDVLYEPVASASIGIWRVHASGTTAVLKLLAGSQPRSEHWPASTDVHDWSYWRREPCAYESGLLTKLEGGLRAPRCIHIANRDDGSVALWLEDVTGRAGSTWQVDDYAPAMERFGRAQGAYLVRGVPTYDWLSGAWLRSYLQQRSAIVDALDDPAVLEHLEHEIGHPNAARARALCTQNAQLLDAIDTFPRTLCHRDLHPANLFDCGDTTVAIDWAFAGVGAIGEDAGNLVPDAVFDFHVDPAEIDRLYEIVVTAYETGLRDAGWRGTTSQLRLALAAAIAAKYVWIAPAIALARRDRRALLNRRPIEETLGAWLPALDFVLDRADEARALLGPAR
jgi:hypothetical protein